MSQKTTIYIPIEISTRELDSKLVLAKALCEKGFDVVLGKKKQLIEYLEIAPAGIFLSIWGGIRTLKKLYHSLSKRGFSIVAMDEEGLITLSDQHYLMNSIDIETLQYVSAFLCWGPKQETLLKNHCSSKTNTKFIATGNIRMDMLRSEYAPFYDKQISHIQTKYPDSLLVISSFGFARHFDGADNYMKNLMNSGVIWNDTLEKSYQDYLRFQQQNAPAFISLLSDLCHAFPERQIIYRPHPSEKIADLDILKQQAGNLFIDPSFNIIAWLRAVSCTIFHYCTTGPEAQILGTANIAYRPFPDVNIENDIPYKNTAVFNTPDGIIETIKQLDSDQKTMIYGDVDFASEISGLAAPSATQNIVNAIESAESNMRSSSPVTMTKKMRFWLKNMFSRETDYVLHKYGNVSSAKIKSILSLIPIAQHKEFLVKKLAKHIYTVKLK